MGSAGQAILHRLRESGPDCWRKWDPLAIDEICRALPNEELAQWPEIAHWRGLAAAMGERADALEYLALAYAGYVARAATREAAVVCHAALMLVLLDAGAMDHGDEWLARAETLDAATVDVTALDSLSALCWQLGWLARVALGRGPTDQATVAAAWLHEQLRPLRTALSPDERLIAARVLVDYHFAGQRYEQFEALASTVEAPPGFESAAPLTRARWCLALGYAHYQVNAHARAEQIWQQGLDVASAAGLTHTRLLLSLAQVRLRVDRGRIAEAAEVLADVQPRWGSGRVAQLIALQQMRARVDLLRGQARQAATWLDDALRLGADAGLPVSELASCLTDRVQVLIALDRHEDAAALLRQLAAEHAGRDRQVFNCLAGLLTAWRLRADDGSTESARAALAAALQQAQALRYTMFFRLLPALAAGLCGLALRWSVEAGFAREVIAARGLSAPPDADARWPWPCWVRLLGGFELMHHGQVRHSSGKTQHKPLELLRLLACERTLSIGMGAAISMLWSQADDSAGRKSLEMTVQRLRKLLGDDSLVRVGDGRVALDGTRVGCDLQQRRRAIDRLEALAIHGPLPSDDTARRAACRSLVTQVIEFGGALLPGSPDAAWLEGERRRCARDTVRAALAAATLLEVQDVSPAEQALLRSALSIEPLAEGLVLRLIRSHARAGQRAQALQVYESFARDLAASGLAPSAAMLALWRSLFSEP